MQQIRTVNAAIVGGGPGCKAIMEMIFAEKLNQLRLRLIGVASHNSTAVGYQYAQERAIFTTRDYRDLYTLNDLNMIIELTGREEVATEIIATKPDHVRLMDHVAARLFWDIFQIEEERIKEREHSEEALKKARDELEQRVGERTAALARANEELRHEIQERRFVEETLRQRTLDLDERIKELNCLYDISERVTKRGTSVKETLQGAVDLLPLGWQHSNVACARIVLEGQEFTTENFIETQWKQVTEIVVHGKSAGVVEVFYLEEKPKRDEGPFLNEERHLLTAVAQRLGRTIERLKAEEALKEREETYRRLFETSPDGITIITLDGQFLEANQAYQQMVGYALEELRQLTYQEITPKKWHKKETEAVAQALEKDTWAYEKEYVKKDGKVFPVFLTGWSIKDKNGNTEKLGAFVRNITARKQAERALRQKEGRLEDQAQHLEKINTALKVLVEHREEEKKKLEANILNNVTKLVFPYIEKMEKSRTHGVDRTYLGIIKSNLKDLISPFADTLSSRYLDLTPTEIQIADLIKLGKKTGEIAALLNISSSGVSFHRNNIRRKLGLLNKKKNLRSYLQSLSSHKEINLPA
jgi:PAS domain S-box-containing protein